MKIINSIINSFSIAMEPCSESTFCEGELLKSQKN